jgi:gamma-glutamyltranspeptidase/glutathione hydrolase
MVYIATSRTVSCIAGVGVWPRAATIDAVQSRLDAGVPVGIAMAVVPASLDAWLIALERYVTWTFGQVARPAAALARDGFPVSGSLAHRFQHWKSFLVAGPGARPYYPGGRPLNEGEVLCQDDLAATLDQLIAAEREGRGDRSLGLASVRRAFYEGSIAERMADFCQRHGGFLDLGDLASFRVHIESPVGTDYRGYRVLCTPPWSQGPVLLQILAILEHRWRDRLPTGPSWYHDLIEAIKLAFADRERYYGDPRFVEVPLDRLLSTAHATAQAGRIRNDVALSDHTLGLPPGIFSAGETAHITVVDSCGNIFSATPSDGWADVPSPPVDGLGFNISPRGSQSRLDPNHPAPLAPGRRPRITPFAVIVLQGNVPRLALGTPGGDMQCQALAQVLTRMLDRGWNGQAAVEAPRIGMLAFPNSFYPYERQPYLWAEFGIPRRVLKKLSSNGHEVRLWPPCAEMAGGVCGVSIDPSRGVLEGFADPRRNSAASGW